MTTPEPHPRWFRPTPGRLLPALLAVEGFLWLSECFHWIPKGWPVLSTVAGVAVFLVLMLLWFAAALLVRGGHRVRPAGLLLVLLAAGGLLLLSQRFHWLGDDSPMVTAWAGVGAAVLLVPGWFVLALFSRWQFQFTIRTLLVLPPVVAVTCSWLAVEMQRAKRQQEAVVVIRKAAGDVRYDDQECFKAPPPGPAWLRNLMGDDFFVDVTWAGLGRDFDDSGLETFEALPRLVGLFMADTKISDAGLVHSKGLTRLQQLHLQFTKIGDSGLTNVEGLSQLQVLVLLGTQVGDAGLQHLQGLRQLRGLNLAGTKVTDAGLKYLENLTQLQWLVLAETNVTDAGLEHLEELTKLETLDLGTTKVTETGVMRLRRTLPNCLVRGVASDATAVPAIAEPFRMIHLAFCLHDEAILASGRAGSMLVDSKTGAVTRRYRTRGAGAHKYEIEAAAVSPGGEQLLTGSQDQPAILWSISNGAKLHKFDLPSKDGAWTTGVSFSRDGSRIVTCGTDRRIMAIVWDTQHGGRLATLALPSYPGFARAVVFSRAQAIRFFSA